MILRSCFVTLGCEARRWVRGRLEIRVITGFAISLALPMLTGTDFRLQAKRVCPAQGRNGMYNIRAVSHRSHREAAKLLLPSMTIAFMIPVATTQEPFRMSATLSHTDGKQAPLAVACCKGHSDQWTSFCSQHQTSPG